MRLRDGERSRLSTTYRSISFLVLVIFVVNAVKPAASVIVFPTECCPSPNSAVILVFDPPHYVNLPTSICHDAVELLWTKQLIAREWQWSGRSGSDCQIVKQKPVPAFIGTLHGQRQIGPEDLTKNFFDVSCRTSDIRHSDLSAHQLIRSEEAGKETLGGMDYDISDAHFRPMKHNDLVARQGYGLSRQASLRLCRPSKIDGEPCYYCCSDRADENAVAVKKHSSASEDDL